MPFIMLLRIPNSCILQNTRQERIILNLFSEFFLSIIFSILEANILNLSGVMLIQKQLAGL